MSSYSLSYQKLYTQQRNKYILHGYDLEFATLSLSLVFILTIKYCRFNSVFYCNLK